MVSALIILGITSALFVGAYLGREEGYQEGIKDGRKLIVIEKKEGGVIELRNYA